jgi:predicted glycosyltransferase
VVSMGGYNSMLETIAAGVRSVVVPRVKPRVEQLMRARRMAAAGWTTLLEPDRLSPETLLDSIEHALAGPPPARPPAEYLSGLAELAERCRLALMPRALPALAAVEPALP